MGKSHSQIAHDWAHQVKNKRTGAIEARGSRVFYVGDKIYSYGHHFCIARMLPDQTVVMGTHTYSSSTSGHQYDVRHATNHLKTVYCYNPAGDVGYNREHAEREIKDALAEEATERRVQELTRLNARLSAIGTAEKFNEYLAALPEKERVGVKPLEVPTWTPAQSERIGVLRAEKIAKRDERDRTHKERERKNRELRAEKLKARIPEWRAHEFNQSLYDLPAMLRLSKDGKEVQTSHGASIPVSHAKRLWPIVQNCKAVGKGLCDREIKLGHFTLNEIEDNGDIRVGCHHIAYSEIELIAVQLGLLETV